MGKINQSQIFAILAIVIGVLILVGRLSVGFLVDVGAVVAIVLGIWMLVKGGKSMQTTAIVLIVLGAVFLFVPLAQSIGNGIVTIVLGIGLVLYGALKLSR